MTNEDLRNLVCSEINPMLLGFAPDDISNAKDVLFPSKIGDYVIVTKRYVWDGKEFVYIPEGGINEK